MGVGLKIDLSKYNIRERLTYKMKLKSAKDFGMTILIYLVMYLA